MLRQRKVVRDYLSHQRPALSEWKLKKLRHSERDLQQAQDKLREEESLRGNRSDQPARRKARNDRPKKRSLGATPQRFLSRLKTAPSE